MSHALTRLGDHYTKKMVIAILEDAASQRFPIYFVSQLTHEPQALTFIQIAGMIKFQSITILLETGQTYQPGLELDESGDGTFQTITLIDLLADEATLAGRKTP